MRFKGKRLMTLACLLAYFIASVPGTVSFAWHKWSLPCQAEERACSTVPNCSHGEYGKGGRAVAAVCRNDSPTATRTTDRSAEAGQVSPLSTDKGAHPGHPTCPGKCHLCSTGAVPFCFTPSVVMQPPGCLGRVAFDALPSLWQPSPDELIRPPMC